MIRVAIVDDHEIVRRGLRMTILGEEDMELVGEAVDGQDAVDMAVRHRPDVLLLDLQLPQMDGVEAARLIKERCPAIYVLVLTSFDSEAKLHAALQAGVDGYFLKDTPGDSLVEAIRGAASGEPQLQPEIARKLMRRMPAPTTPMDELTDREQDVLRQLARGKTNREIGDVLHLTEQTIKGYVSTVLSKLHATDRTQAALLAVRYGLVSLDELPDPSRVDG